MHLLRLIALLEKPVVRRVAVLAHGVHYFVQCWLVESSEERYPAKSHFLKEFELVVVVVNAGLEKLDDVRVVSNQVMQLH